MYTLVLIVHSWLRWAAIAAGLVAIYNTVASANRESSQPAADGWGLAFMVTMDVQMLLGLILYFALSPTTAAVFGDFGAAMKNSIARFWAVEHIGAMLFAVVMIHVGRVLARKAATPAAKRSRLMFCLVAAMIAILLATPWPGLANGRPLFRV